jgi:hypothetical protein
LAVQSHFQCSARLVQGAQTHIPLTLDIDGDQIDQVNAAAD